MAVRPQELHPAHTSPIDLLLIESIDLSADQIDIYLTDGRHISAPLDWFPRLSGEKRRDRCKWEKLRWGVWQELARQRRQTRISATDKCLRHQDRSNQPNSLPETADGDPRHSKKSGPH